MKKSAQIQNSPENYLERIFQLIAPASTVELLKEWYIKPNCAGVAFCEQGLKSVLEKISDAFPNLSLIISVINGILTESSFFPWGDSRITPDASIHYLETEIQDKLQKMVSRLLFGLETSYINAISGEMYESKEAKGVAVAITPPNPSLLSLKKVGVLTNGAIENTIGIKYDQIHGTRKLLQSVSPRHCAVLCAPGFSIDDNHFTFGGIALVDECMRFPIIVFRSHMQWELHLPNANAVGLESSNASVCYQGGRLCIPQIQADKFIEDRVDKYAHANGLGNTTNLKTFLKAIMSQHTGALIIVGTRYDIQREARRLSKHGRGYLFKPSVSLGTIKTGKKTGNEFATEFFTHISSVDGALLCSYNTCFGYGFILDGDSVQGRPDRGARHNSALSYVNAFKRNCKNECMAFVLSEDGMVSIY